MIVYYITISGSTSEQIDQLLELGFSLNDIISVMFQHLFFEDGELR